jgi:hypothetical protein
MPVNDPWAVALKDRSPVADATALSDCVRERGALTDAQAEPVIVAVAEGDDEAPLEADCVAGLVGDARKEDDGGAEPLVAALADEDAVPDTVRARELVGEPVDEPVPLAEVGAVLEAKEVRDDAADLLAVDVADPPVEEGARDALAVCVALTLPETVCDVVADDVKLAARDRVVVALGLARALHDVLGVGVVRALTVLPGEGVADDVVLLHTVAERVKVRAGVVVPTTRDGVIVPVAVCEALKTALDDRRVEEDSAAERVDDAVADADVGGVVVAERGVG